ncbi:MAG TPA: hypothetical protein C5S50_05030 [Methanosarcinaceae archaeon]|nr:hypothetical protein [Methanosarcinaceae archaeon]
MNETTNSIKKLFGVAARSESYLNIIYLLLAFPMGTSYFVFLVTELSLGLSLSIIWIGIPILLLMFAAWWGLVMFERQLAIYLLHIDIPPISHNVASGLSVWVQLKTHLGNPLTWKGLIYLFARFPLGVLSFVVAFPLIILTGALVFAPLTYTDPVSQIYIFSWQIDTLNEAMICSIVGFGMGLVLMHIMNGMAFVSGRFAILMLGTAQDTNEILKEGC